MAIADGSIELVKYARDLAEPHVAGVLYQLARELTCGTHWTRSRDYYFGGELQASPRPTPGDDDNFAIRVDTCAQTALGEYTTVFSNRLPPWHGDKRGIVRLETTVTVLLMSLQGTSEYFQPVPSVGKHGWLYRSGVYRTADGGMCFQLNTRAGRLWFRQAKQEGSPLLLEMRSLSQHIAPRVVHMAECGHTYRVFEPLRLSSGLWQGFQTRDESGRVWTIDSSDVNVVFSCHLDPGAIPDDHLRGSTPLALTASPPYDAVWEPAGSDDKRLRIPLQLN